MVLQQVQLYEGRGDMASGRIARWSHYKMLSDMMNTIKKKLGITYNNEIKPAFLEYAEKKEELEKENAELKTTIGCIKSQIKKNRLGKFYVCKYAKNKYNKGIIYLPKTLIGKRVIVWKKE